MSPLLFHEFIHAADIFVDDLACQFQLIAETFQGLFIRSDLGIEELDSDFLIEFFVQRPVDFTHPPLA